MRGEFSAKYFYKYAFNKKNNITLILNQNEF